MKPVPLLLLLSSILLSSHLRPAAGRPRVFPGWLDEELPGDNILGLLRSRSPLGSEEEAEEAPLLKRSDEPPLSIDLTFHLLRNMIQMAKLESQRERAQFNRKLLDEVGK
uniref:Corticotropin-releasing factor domain-containing protein n=1 Tax=Mola mola TaxID=94237 RepID=A0A3Q3WRI9_MOLML